MVSTHLKNVSQNGFIFPKDRGENSKKYLSCHHLVFQSAEYPPGNEHHITYPTVRGKFFEIHRLKSAVYGRGYVIVPWRVYSISTTFQLQHRICCAHCRVLSPWTVCHEVNAIQYICSLEGWKPGSYIYIYIYILKSFEKIRRCWPGLLSHSLDQWSLDISPSRWMGLGLISLLKTFPK